jgi:HK97 family phage portal protein
MAIAMEKHGANFFANEARSGGFIQHPDQLSPIAQKNLQESVNAQGGLENSHRIKILEEGAKYIQVTIPNDAAQFLESREFQLSEFARMFNVPLVLLQSQEGSTVWGTGIESLMIAFVTYTLGPWLRQLELEYNEKLFTTAERESGLYIKYQSNALLRGDMAGRAAWYKAMAEIGGLNANQIRELEEMNAVDGLDTYFHPSSWTPYGDETDE